MSLPVPISGISRAHASLLAWPAGFISNLLPPGLQLVPQSICPEGQHPVLLEFNRQHLVYNYLGGLSLDYDEFILRVPFVALSREPERGPFSFPAILYLDSEIPEMGGRIFWEMNKVLAKIEAADELWKIRDEDRKLLIESAWDEPTHAPDHDQEVKGRLESVFNLPLIVHGVFGFCTCDYKMAVQGAIHPQPMQVRNGDCHWLPEGSTNAPPFAGFGGFRFEYQWDLSFLSPA